MLPGKGNRRRRLRAMHYPIGFWLCQTYALYVVLKYIKIVIYNYVIITYLYILKLHSFRIAQKALCDANHTESSFRQFTTTSGVYVKPDSGIISVPRTWNNRCVIWAECGFGMVQATEPYIRLLADVFFIQVSNVWTICIRPSFVIVVGALTVLFLILPGFTMPFFPPPVTSII